MARTTCRMFFVHSAQHPAFRHLGHNLVLSQLQHGGRLKIQAEACKRQPMLRPVGPVGFLRNHGAWCLSREGGSFALLAGGRGLMYFVACSGVFACPSARSFFGW